MKHLDDEDIARMIEGNISKKERKDFLEHLSQCETCLSVYSETLEFVEKEKKSKFTLSFPGLKERVRGFGRAVGPVFTIKNLVPAAALLLIIILAAPFLLVENVKVSAVKGFFDGENGGRGFAGSKNKIYAAVRAGILVEDLAVLVNHGGSKKLKRKISAMLTDDLNLISGTETPLFAGPAKIERENIERVVQRIRQLMKKHALTEFFQLGRFLEQSLLAAFDGKMPRRSDIEKYKASPGRQGLPAGVFKGLEKMEPTGQPGTIRRTCTEIKEIFFE